MKKLILSIFLMPLFFTAHTQTWKQQITGSTASLGSIKFANDSVGYCVGGTTFLKTVDRGLNWTTMSPISTNTGLYNVFFIDQDNGWATSNSSSVFKTVDGGLNWSGISTGTSSHQGVFFTDQDTGWVVAFGGAIVKTNDGGDSWNPQTSGVSTDLINVFFESTNVGWVIGYGGVILKTTNGGGNWTPQSSGTTEDLYGVYFIDANTGWVCGWNGVIKKNTDGGTTWVNQNSGSAGWLTDVHFTSASEGWITGQGGKIYTTVDGGTTWTNQTLNTAGGVLMSNDFIDSHQGWVCTNNGRIFRYCQLIKIQSSDLQAAEFGSATFTITPEYGSSTYQWQKQNGSSFVNMANDSKYNGVATNTLNISSLTSSDDNTNYRCIVSYADCSDTSTIAALDVSVLNVAENAGIENYNLKVFPNPSIESVFIQYVLPMDQTSALIVITSSQGQEMKKLMLTKQADKIELNSSEFESGLYIINFVTKEGLIKTTKWLNGI